DSGKVKSGESTLIDFGGAALKSRKQAWWKVRVWDANGKPSEYSEPAHWEIGLLSKKDWVGKWIGRRVLNKRAFTLHNRNWIWYPEGNPAVDAPLAPRFFRKSFTIRNQREITDATLLGIVDDEATVYLNGKKIGDIHGFKFITTFPLTKA